MNLKEFYESRTPKSDKGTTHDYILGYYNQEFTPRKIETLNILEIGVANGESITLWRDWFINSKIYGIDNGGGEATKNEYYNTVIKHIDNVNIILEDAYDPKVLNHYLDATFDYIIDDGPHTLESQLYSMKNWFKKIKSGGKLIIEDIQSITDLNRLVLYASEIDAEWKVYDTRKNKGRYDDIILEIIAS